MAKITKTTTKVQPKFKAYVSELTIILETMLVRGRAVNVCKSKDQTNVSFSYCSPEDANPVEQCYKDTVTGKYYKVEDLHKRPKTSKDDDEVPVLTSEALKELRESQLPKNVLTLSVFRAAEVNSMTYWDSTEGYVFQPETGVPQNILFNNMLAAAIHENPQYVLLGMCNLHGHEGLFRLDVWRGNLTLHKIKYPSSLNDHPVRDHNIDEKGVKAISAVLDKIAKPFDPAAFHNRTAERIFAALADPDAFNQEQEEEEGEDIDMVTDVSSVLDALGLS